MKICPYRSQYGISVWQELCNAAVWRLVFPLRLRTQINRLCKLFHNSFRNGLYGINIGFELFQKAVVIRGKIIIGIKKFRNYSRPFFINRKSLFVLSKLIDIDPFTVICKKTTVQGIESFFSIQLFFSAHPVFYHLHDFFIFCLYGTLACSVILQEILCFFSKFLYPTERI